MEKTFVRTNDYFIEFNSYLEDLQNKAKNLSLKQSELDKKQQKVLHWIEANGELTTEEKAEQYDKLYNIRVERRKVKNFLLQIQQILQRIKTKPLPPTTKMKYNFD